MVTNNFIIDELDFDELNYVCLPFVGCPGQLEIHIHDSAGTEAERKAIYDHMTDLFNMQKRASGFLTPIHSALHTYWYNMASNREKYDVRGLKDVARGRPILYCGAGPSLEKNIDLIREIRRLNAAYIVTGGTGIKILHNHGIIPHLCLAVDPFMQEVERFEGLTKEWQKKTLLLASASLNPICYEGWKGRLIAAEGLNCMPVSDYIEEDPVKMDEGPVGVTTWFLNLAEFLGGQTIYSIGTDLCFGEDGATYADDMDMTANEYIQVDDYQGKTTRTNWIFEAQYLSKVIAEKGYDFTNCSNGLKIPNTKEGSLTELITEEKQERFSAKLTKWSIHRQHKIKRKLRDFASELMFTHDNLADPEIREQPGYKYLLKSYDDLQEYQYWRTGMYNYSLIREVCYKNAELIHEIIGGKEYEGELPIGHLGSPQTPEEKKKKKVRTGSKHKGGGANETVGSNSNTRKTRKQKSAKKGTARDRR